MAALGKKENVAPGDVRSPADGGQQPEVTSGIKRSRRRAPPAPVQCVPIRRAEEAEKGRASRKRALVVWLLGFSFKNRQAGQDFCGLSAVFEKSAGGSG